MTRIIKPERRRFLADIGMTGGRLRVAGAGSKLTPSRHNYFDAVLNPCFVNEKIDSRSESFKNATGERGVECMSMLQGVRKSKAGRALSAGEKVVLADAKGPGMLCHIWMALDWRSPEMMRALRLEGFNDGMSEPSISVPRVDFCGLPHGRVSEFCLQLLAVPEGRGVNSYIPMPFGRSIRIELTNETEKHTGLAYQIDCTLEPLRPVRTNYLHASFRRENPTTLRRDLSSPKILKGQGASSAAWWAFECSTKHSMERRDENLPRR